MIDQPITPITRRGFLGAIGVSTAGSAVQGTQPPKAWIIVALGWEHNDEFAYPEGEHPQPQVFYDRSAAEVECKRLVDEFFAAETPLDFEPDYAGYLDEYPEDESLVTWDELRAGGFPDPYYVMELQNPQRKETA